MHRVIPCAKHSFTALILQIKEANQHSDHAATILAYTDSLRTQVDKFKQQITTLAT